MDLGDLDLAPESQAEPSRTDDRAKEALRSMKRVVIVGASDNPLRKCFRVARFLEDHGIDVVELATHVGVAGLDPVPDAALVFCSPMRMAEVGQALEASPLPAIWFQEGLIDPGMARTLEASGKVAVMDRCVMRDYRRYVLDEEVESWFPI
jgi:hypothetical protein